ncbi:DUF7560 family zinc ribbon protein [Natrarchaeobius oligotrophus]|uniref:Zinc ribbon domain-containing protein n=1 Tax=Natrarchaeobius chitinivorans TaxID=1679083 RepID=A0A3N6MBI5_NATCH|nr:zinc ribbon domain-containing protein [Natrarchaeobius chitinivorans]RQG99957.1 zinc ribbon domain-containing protein [Natrarchaeobius chitinivorans]
MTTHEYTCPDCTGTIDLPVESLEATVEHGCPLCGASVDRVGVATG